ncbi:hypothetical protein SAMN05444672_13436 [Bacillus sp. OK838]|nr:hypothetical protein SAMN05444672_13436 [Bacillus sp. OK838]
MKSFRFKNKNYYIYEKLSPIFRITNKKIETANLISQVQSHFQKRLAMLKIRGV